MIDYKQLLKQVLEESLKFLNQYRNEVAAQSDDTEVYMRGQLGTDVEAILAKDAASINAWGEHKAKALEIMDRCLKRAFYDLQKTSTGNGSMGHIAGAAQLERTRIMQVLEMAVAGRSVKEAVQEVYSASFGIKLKKEQDPDAGKTESLPALDM